MPEKSAEERARLGALVDAEGDAFRRMSADTAAKNRDWDQELAMLERRVKEEIALVDLGNGDTIAIRAGLSEAEAKRIQALSTERDGLSPEADAQRLEDIAYEIVAIVTANPMITAEWLRENQDKIAVSDMLTISLSWYSEQAQRAKDAVIRARSFR